MQKRVIYVKVDQTIISPSLDRGWLCSTKNLPPQMLLIRILQRTTVVRTIQSFGKARAKVEVFKFAWSTVILFCFVSCPKLRRGWPTFCEFSSLCRLLIVMIVLLCTRPSVYTMEIISLALYIRLRVLIYFFFFWF